MGLTEVPLIYGGFLLLGGVLASVSTHAFFARAVHTVFR